MLLVGEKINILNPVVYQALCEKDPDPIRKIAHKQAEAGVHALDVNLGPGKEMGALLPWVVEIVQEAAELPLFLGAHLVYLSEGLKVHRGRPVINAVTADPDILPRAMAAAECFDGGLVVLLVRFDGLPASPDECCMLAEEVLEAAERCGFPTDGLYLDPVLHARTAPDPPGMEMGATDLTLVLDALSMIRHLRTDPVNTIVALGNVSATLPPEIRSRMQRNVLSLLKCTGLAAAILNPMDRELMRCALSDAEEVCSDRHLKPQAWQLHNPG